MLRKLITRLVIWLCKRFEINIVEQRRIVNGTDAVARAQRWEMFAREEGGLYDMLDGLRREGFEAVQELQPTDTDGIYSYAVSDRAIRRLKGHVQRVVADGVVEKSQIKAAEAAKEFQPIMKSVR